MEFKWRESYPTTEGEPILTADVGVCKFDKLFTIHINAVSHGLGAVLNQGYGGQKKVNE